MKKMIKPIVILVSLLMLTSTVAMADSQSMDANVAANAVSSPIAVAGNVASDNVSLGAPIPGTIPSAPVLNYFGQPLPSEGFQPVEDIIMYDCWFTEGALESMLKGYENVRTEFNVANESIGNAPTDGDTKWIKVIISRKKYDAPNARMKGYVTANSQSKNTHMVKVFASAALEALHNGCNVVHFSAQGAVRDVFSSGWSIGFNTTQAQIYSADMTKSNVSTGGMGYSNAEAGTRDKPWLQGFGLVDPDLQYPTVQ